MAPNGLFLNMGLVLKTSEIATKRLNDLFFEIKLKAAQKHLN